MHDFNATSETESHFLHCAASGDELRRANEKNKTNKMPSFNIVCVCDIESRAAQAEGQKTCARSEVRPGAATLFLSRRPPPCPAEPAPHLHRLCLFDARRARRPRSTQGPVLNARRKEGCANYYFHYARTLSGLFKRCWLRLCDLLCVFCSSPTTLLIC